MDMDGDGILSLYELQHFYEEMIDKMDALGIESLSIEDYMCQVGLFTRSHDPFVMMIFCL